MMGCEYGPLNMSALTQHLAKQPKIFFVVSGMALVALVGGVDYLSGYAIFLSAFYLLPVALAAWFVGGFFGIVISVLSVAVWFVGDIAAGARYPSIFVPIWNAAIDLTVYFVVVKALTSLKKLHIELEERVRQRTAALTNEVQERARLEKEILEISEREQRRIGNDLHDSVCQHLAATAMAGQILGDKLAAKSVPEASDAREIVKLLEGSILLTRNLARGIAPLEMDAEGLVTALSEFTENISQVYKLECVFDCNAPPKIDDAVTATHLYRITQEAVNNAVRHAKAKNILVSLWDEKGRLELTIEDDGAGMPADWEKKRGMGTHIMAHRAAMIGGIFSIEPNPTGGTLVRCSVQVLTAGKKLE